MRGSYLGHRVLVRLLDRLLMAFVVNETDKTCLAILRNLLVEMLLRGLEL